ncbi:aminotransferase class III-fold pyridoxal phosphate-dependent enzyme [Streptomyces sp. enrichment culture]|uniref:aminotransferase class III-fold pyridoxal phosphate-dependent enzyme n=1 Tax=Streptomyces sp. enrichment culture TaxID=1795815 RepID=UPI003F55619E
MPAYGVFGEEASARGRAFLRGRAVQEGASRRRPAREPAARTYARAVPVVPVRARGLTIEDAEGRRYLDCVSGAGTLALGHNHPAVLEAIRRVLDSGAPLQVMDLTTPVEDAFVTELLRTLPPGLADHARVRFCGSSGTEPVDTAVALVRAVTGRDRTVTAHRWVPDGSGPGRTQPAGLFLEPVGSAAEVRPAPDTFVRHLRALTTERAVPLVVDERETGVGRTGAFWAFEHSGVVPDVVVLAKAIGGSLPLAAVVHRADLYDPDDPATSGPEGGGFRGNQLALAAGAATLAHVREHRLAEHAAALGARTLDRLRPLAERFTCVADVRGRGLLTGIELATPDGDVREHRPDCARGSTEGPAGAVQRECLRRGLIVDATGPAGNVVRLMPPLIVTEEQMTAVLDRLADALEAVDRRFGDSAPLRGRRAPR